MRPKSHLLLTAALIFLRLLQLGSSETIPNFDLATAILDAKKTGFILSGFAAGDRFGSSVYSAGDINKDGYPDIIVGAPFWSSGRGAAYVFFGGPTNGFADIDISTTSLNPASTGFAILGQTAGDQLGRSVSAAGDVNGDGIDDIVIGANTKGGNQGAAYVIYGKQTWTAHIDLGTTALLPQSTGFMITGDAVGDQFGYVVSSAGDMNRDHFGDIIVGAYAKASGRGAAYVIYGGPTATRVNIFLSTALIPTSTGFTITGFATGHNLGCAVALVGDVNGDGYKDIAVGAEGANTDTGRIYVIFNIAAPTNLDFSTGINLVPTSTGFTVGGQTASNFGFSVSPAGDVNGDGKADILVGAWGVASGAGAAYVIYGKASPPQVMNLETTPLNPATSGFKISGDAAGDHLGSAVSAAGDLNGDGFGDIIVGADWASSYKGKAYVIYGKQYPTNVMVASPALNPATTGFTITGGSAGSNNLGFGLGVADVNNDGVPDLLVGAFKQNSGRGAVYVIHTACMTAHCVSCANKVCTSCDGANGWFLSGTVCVTSCPIKTYASTATGKCEPCLTNCDVCADSSTCSLCSAGNFLYQSSSCSSTCPLTTYGNAGVCSACPSDCDTCTSGSICTYCSANYFLSGSSCTQNCPSRFFGSTASWKCESCSSDCLTCTSASLCQTCDQKYALVNNACEVCPDNCDACTSSTSCYDCTSPYLLYEMWCLTGCPHATFAETTTGKCESCPKHCASCTSLSACQVCEEGYIKASGSSCVLPPNPTFPKTESTATKAITSGVTAAGSLVCVGSVTFPQTTLVSKIVQNMRYINLTVTNDLALVYQTWSTNLINWNFPNFLEDLDDFREAPRTFSQYSLSSPFLANFWSTLMTLGVTIGVLICCILLKIFLEQSQNNNGWVYRLLQRLVLGAFNFALVQVYGCVDDILFYSVLDTKGNPFNSSYDWGSIICASLFLAAGCYLIYFNFRTVRNYQRIKTEAKARKDNDAIEAFNERNKYWELFYSDFNDTDVWSQSTLALLVIRSTFSSFIIAVLYGHPLVQMILLIILDAAMMLFLIIKNPFTTLRGKLAQYYFETITLLVHLVGLILSFQRPFDDFSQNVLAVFCTSIIYLNMGLMIGSVGFMFIELYKVISQKIKLKRTRKYKTIAIQTGCDNSYNETQITSTSGLCGINTLVPMHNREYDRQEGMGNKQVAQIENDYSREMSMFTEENNNNNISFTGVNLLNSNNSNFNLNTDDFVLQQDFNRGEGIFHQGDKGQSRVPITVFTRNVGSPYQKGQTGRTEAPMNFYERNEEIQHQRGQTGVPITAQSRRRNVRKRLPEDLITL